MEKVPKIGGKKQERAAESYPDLEKLKAELRAHLRDNVVKVKELREKAEAARRTAFEAEQRAAESGLPGIEFRGDFILNSNDKGHIALLMLNDALQREVTAHGLGVNKKTHDPNVPIDALISVLATGELKGDFTRLEGGPNVQVFKTAPFVLLSNRGEMLAEMRNGVHRLTGLRTVMVNGQYEAMLDDLRAAFPWVSFRTADEITDDVFDKKEPEFESYEDKIDKAAKAESLRRQLKKP